MKTIYKYPFKIEDEVIIEMPKGARVLSVQCQDDMPTMWALVDTQRERWKMSNSESLVLVPQYLIYSITALLIIWQRSNRVSTFGIYS